MVFELFESNLVAELKNLRPGLPSNARSKRLMFQILHGLKIMHACVIAHRDAKPANILLKENGSVACVCDYGLSVDLNGAPKLSSNVVTRAYRPPELLLQSSSSEY